MLAGGACGPRDHCPDGAPGPTDAERSEAPAQRVDDAPRPEALGSVGVWPTSTVDGAPLPAWTPGCGAWSTRVPKKFRRIAAARWNSERPRLTSIRAGGQNLRTGVARQYGHIGPGAP